MSSELTQVSADYRAWLGELKARFRQVQLKAAVAVNTALLQFYWDLGADMVTRQARWVWGSGFIKQLSTDLMSEFPEMTGFSASNLKYIRQWHLFWAADSIGQHPVGRIGQQGVAQFAKPPVSQILSIPWGHNLAFEPEHAGKLNFYIKAIDEQWRSEGDQPTIGLLLCKNKDRLVAEYALSDIHKPMGVSEYTLSHTLPESLRDKLPSIEAIERELGLDGLDGAGGGV